MILKIEAHLRIRSRFPVTRAQVCPEARDELCHWTPLTSAKAWLYLTSIQLLVMRLALT